MAEILTKSEFARTHGVKPAAVSNWIARGKLTPPALRPDGMIDAAAAEAQLNVAVDVVRRVARQAPAPSPAGPIDFGASRQLLRAKATMAEIAAERARRQLQAEIGRYVLATEAETAWAAELARFLLGVEQSLPDLALSLGLDHGQARTLRRWWREQRASAADRARARAAASPEFIEDPAA